MHRDSVWANDRLTNACRFVRHSQISCSVSLRSTTHSLCHSACNSRSRRFTQASCQSLRERERRQASVVRRNDRQITMKDEKKYPAPTWIYLYAVFGIAVVAVAIFLYSKQFGNNLSYKLEDWAQFGDFFGGALGPTFAFFSFLALLHTIVLQNRELRLTREELSDSREIADQQKKSIILQRLETTFFQLLTLHYKVRDNLIFKNENGLSAFSQLNQTFEGYRNREESLIDLLVNLEKSIEKAKQENTIFNADGQSLVHSRKFLSSDIVYLNSAVEQFRSYLNSFRYLLEFVTLQKELKENSTLYFGMIKSQLTNSEELFLLRFSLEPNQDISEFVFFPIITRNNSDAKSEIEDGKKLLSEVKVAFNPKLIEDIY